MVHKFSPKIRIWETLSKSGFFPYIAQQCDSRLNQISRNNLIRFASLQLFASRRIFDGAGRCDTPHFFFHANGVLWKQHPMAPISSQFSRLVDNRNNLRDIQACFRKAKSKKSGLIETICLGIYGKSQPTNKEEFN